MVRALRAPTEQRAEAGLFEVLIERSECIHLLGAWLGGNPCPGRTPLRGVHMYIMSKRYSVAEARQHLADVLDLAEKGQDVAIERRGVRFVVKAETRRKRMSGRRPSRIEIADPAVRAGAWTWSWTPDGLGFRDTRSER